MDSLEKIRKIIKESIPKSAEITNVEFEGPEISVYSKNENFIGNDHSEIKN
ncbi:MAG: hypothetical protein ACTSQ5_14980, partial [Promethearchaeota archaeon]